VRRLLVEMALDISYALNNFRPRGPSASRAEKRNWESEEKFRVMSRSAQDAIIMIDNDGISHSGTVRQKRSLAIQNRKYWEEPAPVACSGKIS